MIKRILNELFSSKPAGKVHAVRVPQVRFLGEQDGPAEGDLKGRLVALFESGRAVEKAYLVRVDYGAGSPVNVSLAIRGASDLQQTTAEQVARVFASMFNAQEHLDILFLTKEQDAEVVAVCKPFFDRSKSG